MPPPEATLLVLTNQPPAKPSCITMERHLADPVFGAECPSEVSRGGAIIASNTGAAKPAISRSRFLIIRRLCARDALLHFPVYTGLTNETHSRHAPRQRDRRHAPDLHIPTQQARDEGRARFHQIGSGLNLALKDNAVALLADYHFDNSGRYSLALVDDADGRSSKFPADIVLRVLTNRPPELKLIFPQGDQRVTRLEELQLQAEARGEFGLLKYGIGFGAAGEEPRIVELGQSVAPRNEKRQFNYLLRLETLPLEPDQVLSYFVWADDYGPDGNIRRTFGDMFFAEVRPFEETFRAGRIGRLRRPGPGPGTSSNREMPADELAEMQKEIVIATWKLRQQKPPAQYIMRSP